MSVPGDAEKVVRLESFLDARLAEMQANFYADQDRRLLLEIEARESHSHARPEAG